ncbi:MAG: TOBE domain-containing protein, partial [Rhodobacteraceae bacterium]|nr:TOBE domain-containing protein [Paracoccaceae bacterium]
FDEPLSNLDAQLRTQMRLEIKKLHQRVGNTIVFVTHDQVEAMTLADRIVIMMDGHIQQVGTPDEVYHKPANTFVAQFIGAPSMNMMRGKVTGNTVTLEVGTTILLDCGLADGREVTVGVRPDDLHPAGSGCLVSGAVSVREPLGAETLLHVDTGHGDIVAKADGRKPPAVGQLVKLDADPENLHIFDPETGVALI